MERKLVAILSADVAGYTRLMEADGAGTLVRLQQLRKSIIDPAIGAHNGRIVKLIGDGTLAEFASVVDAVSCAISVHDLRASEPSASGASRIQFRIGINVGDVMIDGSDIYGEGVNIASRIEGLAKPGGIAISGIAHEHPGTKLTANFEDAGFQSLKNLEKPVRVYLINPMDVSDSAPLTVPSAMRSDERRSIAVLPFLNMSDDPQQEYFADGVTEDIITELSRFKGIVIIARNTVFQYKGQSSKIQNIGRDLGAHWVVEGSIRKSGNRTRISVQLIDAETGVHHWAERYDRSTRDIFEVQDEVVRSIASAIPGHVGRAAEEHIARRPAANLTAFDHLLKARWLYRVAEADLEPALQEFAKAIEADPTYALATPILRTHSPTASFDGAAIPILLCRSEPATPRLH